MAHFLPLFHNKKQTVPGIRFVILAAFITCLHFVTMASAHAQVYDVDNVAVDATADSAADARQQALAVGEREAFHRLMQRITPQEYHSQLPDPDQATISTYVRDFSVSDEKTSSVRYLANMHVRFRRDDIRQLLNEFGIPFSETVSKPVLVIPVMERNGTFSLWEEGNLWRAAWKQLDSTGRMVPFRHPVGDLSDISAIGPQHAITGDTSRLQPLAKHYDSGSVLVVHAVVNTQASIYTGVEVHIARYGPGQNGQLRTLRFTGNKNEALTDVLARIVSSIAGNLEEDWKSDNLMRLHDRGILAASIPVNKLSDWLKMQQRLKQTSIVRGMELVLLSREEVRVNLHYLGDLRQLQVALAQMDIDLSQSEGAWTIRPSQ